MATRTFLALVLILLASVLAAEEVPKDVAEFLERNELCEHFRQEPWPEGQSDEEKERREFIAKQIERFCTGLNDTGRNLRRKYHGNALVIDKLNKVEEWER